MSEVTLFTNFLSYVECIATVLRDSTFVSLPYVLCVFAGFQHFDSMTLEEYLCILNMFGHFYFQMPDMSI
jgi:hypothetical protein